MFGGVMGYMFPIISEAVRGVKISVAAPFFNQVNIPLGWAYSFCLVYVLSLLGGRRVRVISVATFCTL